MFSECFLLKCSFITFENQFPSGKIVLSNDYAGDHYRLILPSPVEDGEYQCSVPSTYNYLACIDAHVPVTPGKVTVNAVKPFPFSLYDNDIVLFPC